MLSRSILGISAIVSVVNGQELALGGLGPTAYKASGVFPTAAFPSYYNNPSSPSAEPQPAVYDPILDITYPYELTNPETVPQIDTTDPHVLPYTATQDQLYAQAITQINSIVASPYDSCNKCHQALQVLKFTALAAPVIAPNVSVATCAAFKLGSEAACQAEDGIYNVGGVVAQVNAIMDSAGADGDAYCHMFFGVCEQPTVPPLNMTNYFAKPKPNPLPPPKKSNGERLNVLHISDFHLDARYMIGAEANCSSGLCCRGGVKNSLSPNSTMVPASRYGYFLCDAPYDLALAALESIEPLIGKPDFTVFTGDLVSHDSENELSRAHTLYTETVSYELFAKYLGPNPVYANAGNHDTYETAQDAPHSLGEPLATQFGWNYDHLSSLFQYHGWLDTISAAQMRQYYGSYTTVTPGGLKLISLNSDFWYNDNVFTYVNYTLPDDSGILRFLADELQAAEDAGQRVWIQFHVPSGFTNSDAVPAPTDLFYQIVERYSPHVIAAILSGHTHDERFSIFYANNGTNPSAETALAVNMVKGSITPQTNVNPGFTKYEVDAVTFEILDSTTYIANVSTFAELDKTGEGPTFFYEYSAREIYGKNISWPADAPINATWWHLVTEQMEINPELVQTFQTLQSKSSAMTKPCNATCVESKVCYMRSASVPISLKNCEYQQYGPAI